MRTTNGMRVVLLFAVIALAPTMARCQDSTGYTRPDPDFPVPLQTRPDLGGPYFASEFLYFHENRPIGNQVVAVRGFRLSDSNINTLINQGFTFPDIPGPGTNSQFVGSGTPALTANAFGNESWQPGWTMYLGWRFRDGLAVDFGWWHLSTARYVGGATFANINFAGPTNLADSFLYAPVFNFSPEFEGTDPKVQTQGTPPPVNGVVQAPQTIAVGTAGIWNAATVMQIFYYQRFDEYNINARLPLFETENVRSYALFGPRLSWIWDRWRWRTVSLDVNGNGDNTDVALYNNIVSNRMYGAHFGCGTDIRLGDTPMGTFACTLELQGATLADFVKEEQKYERGDLSTSAKIATRQFAFVPEVQGSVGLTWYPIEGVELRVGYDAMAFFNTIASENPVSFNFATMKNVNEGGVFRLIQGFRAGVGLSF